MPIRWLSFWKRSQESSAEAPSASEEESALSGDRALTNPLHDRLGYAPFARQLAESIVKLTPSDGLVLAVYGPWGAGKTTLLNFIKHYLKQQPEEQQPLVLTFNPWWFAAREDLARSFFDQLLVAFGKWEVLGKRLRKSFSDFTSLVAEIPVTEVAGPARLLARASRPSEDVVRLKDSIVKELRRRRQKILLIIDDIDRLTTDELRQLFQLIKAVADFPNLVYLLAFDKKVAIKALSEAQGIPGEEYLEKIVQVPVELPLPDKPALRRLLFERLDQILEGTPTELFDATYWQNVYHEGIDHLISTPRDVVRLTNTLSVTYAAVRGEVNSVDFIAIEALRVFEADVYDLIRHNPDHFTGVAGQSALASAPTDDVLKQFHSSWIEQVGHANRERLKALLRRVFPKLDAVWGNTYRSADDWRRLCRVASPDIFPVYFRLAVPGEGISNLEMGSAVELTSSRQAFGARLVELSEQVRPDGTTRVRAFLERLEDYTASAIPPEHVPNVFLALFDIGDELLRPEDESRGMFDYGNDIRIGRVNWQLLRRLDQPARTSVLKEAIQNGRALSMIMSEVIVLGQQHGRHIERPPDPESERFVTEDVLNELETLVLSRIRAAAQDGTLIDTPRLGTLLYWWREWGDESEPKEWLIEQTLSDDGLFRILGAYGQVVRSQSLDDVVGSTGYRLNPKELEPLMDLEAIAQRLQDIRSSGLTDDRRKIAEQFLREYELIKQGLDPNNPTSWMPR